MKVYKTILSNMFKILKILSKIPQFFARKFDPIINSKIINKIDETMHGKYMTSKI